MIICFNTCSSCEEQPAVCGDSADSGEVSIHAPLARSNRFRQRATSVFTCFNTCSSCEEQLDGLTVDSELFRFNTCSSCEEQLIFQHIVPNRIPVSIHAPLARSNRGAERFADAPPVSIHAPLARSNFFRRSRCCTIISFNTCSSCEEQLGRARTRRPGQGFNTCSSCEEQQDFTLRSARMTMFQYMLLLRGATRAAPSARQAR